MDKSANQKKIGLFGGAFDPVHIGHIQVALAALQQCQLDRVDFITAKEHPLKSNTAMLDAITRHKIVELALTNYPKLQASNIELEREGISYSYQTAIAYREKYPEAKLYWILGLDNFLNISEWKEVNSLVKQVNFIIYPRKQKMDMTEIAQNLENLDSCPELAKHLKPYLNHSTHSPNELILNDKVQILKRSLINISSSEIRQAYSINKALSVEQFIIPSSKKMINMNYIQMNNL